MGRGGREAVTGNKAFRNPHNLPVKDCVVCGRPFTWRKKWERDWDEIQTCSQKCKAQRRSSRGERKTEGTSESDAASDDSDDGDDAHSSVLPHTMKS
jgi:hypothetical protein